ncbi:uncharacterized protein PHALS_02047 [Plasmopara halstedii]|uniref:Uncharacterized protein n=1 Tax=Plasmopara halstedii TaxID=4781 RepID=A0A0P1AVP6_PLAHL|nr:uncharacterized protein PHALS_02047 [Plasmopara halstedii]CEG45774.1 hypothetical protein PHALS_02047 [Plasmopara halstedii]|eukprot:XP_024582143.1 hypothetical protein PHALS_02047 [Plasmopara halstedii]
MKIITILGLLNIFPSRPSQTRFMEEWVQPPAGQLDCISVVYYRLETTSN